jgi:undecaprenyl-diphosphatase
VNQFDFSIVHFLNGFAHRSHTFDALIAIVEESNLLKGGVGLALFWWAWFETDKPASEKREFLVYALVSSCFALLLGRAVALLIPFRERPLRNPLYPFQIPFGVRGDVHSWNSCPSDHAILFFCLATCLWMVSRRLGILAMCHAFFVVSLPRIYVGYHYPTDILAGAVLGIGVALGCKLPRLRKRLTDPAFHWLKQHPASFYAFAFAATFEVAELFQSLLEFQSFVRHGLLAFLRTHF